MARAECIEKVKRKKIREHISNYWQVARLGADTRTFASILAYKATATRAKTRDASLSRHCYPPWYTAGLCPVTTRTLRASVAFNATMIYLQ